ncbi:MAG: AIR synthase-related protein [Saprospiraceae bacterium]
MRREDVLVANVQEGDVIVGLASFGQASYEDSYNGGMGSNGLTAARHDVLNNSYAKKYPESYNPDLPAEVVYTGNQNLTNTVKLEDGTEITVGKLLLSPTRTYLPVLKSMLEAHRKDISALIHCTGGGQTKVLKFVKDRHIIKDNLFPVPPLFKLIQESSKTEWKEMYQVFNMGHRMEVYCKPEVAESLIQIAAQYQIDARVVGRVESAQGEHVTIESPFGKFEFKG